MWDLQRSLTEAVEQQTATSEILRVISISPTDIQPVLDAVAANAARVCSAADAVIRRVEGSDMRRVAHFGPIPLVLPEVRHITVACLAAPFSSAVRFTFTTFSPPTLLETIPTRMGAGDGVRPSRCRGGTAHLSPIT
jgi:hypothetical protein